MLVDVDSLPEPHQSSIRIKTQKTVPRDTPSVPGIVRAPENRSCPTEVHPKEAQIVWLLVGTLPTLKRQPLVGSSSRRLSRSRLREKKRGEGATNQISRFSTNPFSSSRPHSQSGKGPCDVKRDRISHDVITSAGEFMSHDLTSHHHLCLGAFPVIELANLRLIANGKVRRFDEGPRQIFIPILGVALPLAFPIAQLGTAHASTVRGELPTVRNRRISPVSSMMVSVKICPMPGTVDRA